MSINIIIGKTYNNLTVMKYDRFARKCHYYICKCTCGKTVSVKGSDLYRDIITNCGCINNDWLNKKYNDKFLEIYSPNLSTSEMAIMVGCSQSYINDLLRQYNLTNKHKIMRRNQVNKWLQEISSDIDSDAKPWTDPESLYCDTQFLKKLLNKEVLA